MLLGRSIALQIFDLEIGLRYRRAHVCAALMESLSLSPLLYPLPIKLVAAVGISCVSLEDVGKVRSDIILGNNRSLGREMLYLTCTRTQRRVQTQ